MRKYLKYKIRGEKGAITLFVLLACLFFLMTSAGVYVSVDNKKQTEEKEIKRIQESYEEDNSIIDEKYKEVEEIAKNEIPTPQGELIKTPNTWTSGNVECEITVTNNTDYTLQYKTEKSGETGEVTNWTNYTNKITISRNQKIYVRYVNDKSENSRTTTIGEISNIDKEKPTIGNLEGVYTGNTENTETININDISDANGSGLKGYYISNTLAITPTSSSVEWIEFEKVNDEYPLTIENVSKTVYENGRYYAWVIDAVGNVSEREYIDVSDIITPVTEATYTNTTIFVGNTQNTTLEYTGTPKKVTFSISEGNSNASINSTTGEITGISAGNATIIATIENYNGTTITKTITVTVVATDISFSYTPNGWTNGTVNVEITTQLEGYTIQYATEKTGQEGETSKNGSEYVWVNYGAEVASGVPITRNQAIYARLLNNDTEETSKYVVGNVEKIDKIAPNEFTPITESTINSIKVTANTTDANATEDYGCSGFAGYRFSSDDGTTWTEYQTSGEYTFRNLVPNISYIILVEAKDNADNSTVESINTATGTIPMPEGEFIKNPEGWTNGNVTCSIANVTNGTGYTLKYATEQTGEEGETEKSGDEYIYQEYTGEFTLTRNQKVYIVFEDNEGNYGRAMEGTIDNIDKAQPAIGSVTGSTEEGNSGKITINNITDTGGSGIKAYCIKLKEGTENPSTPDVNSEDWIEIEQENNEYPSSKESIQKNVEQNGVYYVWVKDAAGNISQNKSNEVKNIVQPVTIATASYPNSTIFVGDTQNTTLTYTGTPKSITFSISEESGNAVSIDSNGKITGIEAGASTVIATIENYNGTSVTISSMVTVKALDISITYNPDNWTNDKVYVKITTKLENYTIEYKTEKTGQEGETTTWTDYNTAYASNGVPLIRNQAIYARLKDDITSETSGERTGNVDKIDKIMPNEFTPTAETTTSSVTITSSTTDANATSDSGCSGIAGYRFSIDNGVTWTGYQTSGEYTYGNLTQNTSYTIIVQAKDNAGNVRAGTTITKSTKTIPTPSGTFSKIPSTWTNGDVTCSITNVTNGTGYTLKYATEETGTSVYTEYTGTFTVTRNQTVYIIFEDNAGNYGQAMVGTVSNIDKEKPTIGNITGSSATGNSSKITLSGIADTGGSGLSGYYISKSNTTPTASSTWISNTESSLEITVNENATYYVWVRDVAGNISETAKSCTISNIVPAVTSATYTNSTIFVGNTKDTTLTYTGTPQIVTYSVTSGSSYVSIDSSTGAVTGIAKGTSTIQAIITNFDGTTVTKTSTVTVIDAGIDFSCTPNSWTNGNVKVTVTATSGYTIQYSTQLSGSTGETSAGSWATYNSYLGITITRNQTVYARLLNSSTGETSGESSINIGNIDTTKPTIANSISKTTTPANSVTMTVSGIADTGGSGLKGYYVSTSSTAPTSTSVTWEASTSSSFTKTVSENGTYYVWVLDNAGNVSDVKTCTVSGIVAKASNVSFSNITLVSGNKTTTASTTTSGSTITKIFTNPTSATTQSLIYSGTPKTITFTSGSTSVATVDSNGVITAVANITTTRTATITVTFTNYDGSKSYAYCTVTVQKAIAKIEQTSIYYGTLITAVKAVPTNSVQKTVTLLSSTSEDVSGDTNAVLANQNILLNLQTYTITGQVENRGTLQISGTGTITKTGANTITNTGTLTFETTSATTGPTIYAYGSAVNGIYASSGTVTINYAKVYANEITSQAIIVQSGATVNIKNGDISQKGNGTGTAKQTIDVKSGAKVNISGGNIYNSANGGHTIIAPGTLNISGGTIESKNIEGEAIRINGGTTTITNGTIKNYAQGRSVRLTDAGKLNLNGGDIMNNGYYDNDAYVNANTRAALYIDSGTTVTMTGGTVENVGRSNKDGQGTAVRVFGIFKISGGIITSASTYYDVTTADTSNGELRYNPLGSLTISASATVTMSGGTVTNGETSEGITKGASGYRGTAVTVSHATLNMTGGTISADTYYMFQADGTTKTPIPALFLRDTSAIANLSGGTIENTHKAGTSASKLGGRAISVRNNTTLTIKSSATVTIASFANTSNKYATVRVESGGTFNRNTNSRIKSIAWYDTSSITTIPIGMWSKSTDTEGYAYYDEASGNTVTKTY